MLIKNCRTCRNIKNCSKTDVARNMPCKDYTEKRRKRYVEINNKAKKRTWEF